MGDIVDLGKFRKKRNRSQAKLAKNGRSGGPSPREKPAKGGADSAEGRRGELIKIEPDPEPET